MGDGVSRSPGSLYVGCKKRKPAVDRGPVGEVLCPGVRWLRKWTFLKLQVMPLTEDRCVILPELCLFFSSSKSRASHSALLIGLMRVYFCLLVRSKRRISVKDFSRLVPPV